MKRLFLIALVLSAGSLLASPLPGVKPVDVYLNFEKIGFKTTKNIQAGSAQWVSKGQDGGVTYRVETSSSDVNSVELVVATATASGSSAVAGARAFFGYLCTLPVSGVDTAKAKAWSDAAFLKGAGKTVLGGVTYSLVSNGKGLVTMVIEKE